MLISLMDRAKQLGPVLKFVICICVLPVLLILWPVFGIIGSIVGGAAYGFFQPVLATFEAVGEGKSDTCYHCIVVCLKIFVVHENVCSNINSSVVTRYLAFFTAMYRMVHGAQ